MKILVVSDTHGYSEQLLRVLEKNKDFDTLIHLGDGENDFREAVVKYPSKGFVFVCGNCDRGMYQSEHVMKVGNIKIFCAHGHRYRVDTDRSLLTAKAAAEGCSIALYGHTHIPKTEIIDGLQVMNPGSLSSPRNGNKRTYGIITINGEEKPELRIVEA